MQSDEEIVAGGVEEALRAVGMLSAMVPAIAEAGRLVVAVLQQGG